MKKILALILVMIFGLALAGCARDTGEVKAALGQEFVLPISKSAAVTGENLKVKFEKVLEDSRCPREVTCIWAGRVRFLVQITDNGAAENIELVVPGMTDESSQQIYKGYQFTFKVEPYPEAGKEITNDQYRMLMTVSKMK